MTDDGQQLLLLCVLLIFWGIRQLGSRTIPALHTTVHVRSYYTLLTNR